MKKKSCLDEISLKDVKKHLEEEKNKFGLYPIGSKQYDKALSRASLLLEIIKRKSGKKAYKKELKKVINY
jgi:hypothetical protein